MPVLGLSATAFSLAGGVGPAGTANTADVFVLSPPVAVTVGAVVPVADSRDPTEALMCLVLAEVVVCQWLKLAHLLLGHNAIGDAGTNS